MEPFQIILIIAIVFYLLSMSQFYYAWKEFKKLNIGDTITDELREKLMKKIKITILLIAIGAIFNITGTIMS